MRNRQRLHDRYIYTHTKKYLLYIYIYIYILIVYPKITTVTSPPTYWWKRLIERVQFCLLGYKQCL